MKCISCKQGGLIPQKLEPNLPCHECNQCGGVWLTMSDYLNWIDKTSHRAPNDRPAQGALESLTEESASALLCPQSGRIMLKFRLGANCDRSVDYSPAANAVWLDKGEWQLIKQQRLETSLNLVFTDVWQRKIKQELTSQSLEKRFRNRFGDSHYEKLQEIHNWIYSQENPSEFIAYLADPTPLSI